MLIDKLVVIVVAIILNALLVIKYIKAKVHINLLFSLILSFSLGIYLSFVINNLIIPLCVQIILLLCIFIIPTIIIFLEYNNVKIKKYIMLKQINVNIFSKEYNKAINKLKNLIRLFGETSEYLYIEGCCYRDLNYLVSARDCFVKAVDLDKKNYKAYYELGLILDKTGKKDTAVIMYKNAMKLKPDSYDIAESLGICYTALLRYKEAENVYKEAINYHKDIFELYYNLGMINMELKEYDEALENFKIAVKLKSNLYTAYYNIAMISYIKGYYEEAIEGFKKSRNSSTLAGISYFKLAEIFCMRSETEKAMTCLEYSILIDEKYIKEAKTSLIFEPIINEILEFEKNMNLNNDKRRKNNYMENEDKVKKKLEKKINNDILS